MRISDWSSDVCSSDLALPPSETCVPFHKRLTGCGAIISRLVERCLRLNHLRATRFQLICKLLPIGGDCGQRFASGRTRFICRHMLPLKNVEKIGVSRKKLNLGFSRSEMRRGGKEGEK